LGRETPPARGRVPRLASEHQGMNIERSSYRSSRERRRSPCSTNLLPPIERFALFGCRATKACRAPAFDKGPLATCCPLSEKAQEPPTIQRNASLLHIYSCRKGETLP